MLTWLEISKSALVHNLNEFRKILNPKVKLMAVVKSNAYGHGLEGVGKIIENYVDYFGVASLNEALTLRESGIKKPILVLTFWPIDDIKSLNQAIKRNIELAVYNCLQAKILSKLALNLKKLVKIHLKIDTGTSRIGVLPENALNFAIRCLKLKGLVLKGIFTHFAKSEALDQEYTLLQTERLIKVKERLVQNGFKYELLHAACTAASIVNPITHLDMVRIGIGLYGYWPSEETKKLALKTKKFIVLKPALTWKTKVIQVKELPPGTPIGYDCTYRLKKRGKIAVLPVGYWDGYDRKLSNCGEVLIHGKRAPIRGRVCMNLVMVEVTKILNVKVGDEVVLIGRQGNEEITAEEIAKKVGTINYEIITRINPFLLRIYK